ncbi:MAG TPA: 4Fe-4S binding protein [Spirochaetia bacterium]|nr:4Fe-4S binding protein [Spirochaetia bacterium]
MMGDYGTWKGFPREKVPWHPTVDLEKCIGCKNCFDFCSHGVYAWDDQGNRPKVVEPFKCVVGCNNCSHQCEQEAISFPPLTILKEFVNAP